MFQRRARRLAVILEEDDVAEAPVALQIVDAIFERPENFFDLLFRHFAERHGVLRRLDDDLMRADAVHLVVHAVALAVQLAFDAEHRKFVGHDAHAPARLVARRRCCGTPAPRAASYARFRNRKGRRRTGRRRRMPDKIAGALGAIGCNDDPSTRDRVLPQFGQ